MEGGELFQRIQDRAEGAFTERGKPHSLSGVSLHIIDKSLINVTFGN